MPAPADQLAEAKAAYHKLMIGEAALVYVDQNGERVEYNRASAPRLAGYIADLERQIVGRSRPTTLTFKTSKGV